MQISAIMNIHELAANRPMKQRANAPEKKGQKEVKENTLQLAQADMKNKEFKGVMANEAQQQADAKENAHAESFVTGNMVDIHT